LINLFPWKPGQILTYLATIDSEVKGIYNEKRREEKRREEKRREEKRREEKRREEKRRETYLT